MARPKVNSAGQQELDKAQEKFEKFETEVKNLTLDQMNKAPHEDVEPQTKMSSREFHEAPEIYLKPVKTIAPGPIPKTGEMTDKFNEKYRDAWEFDKQYVRFIAENMEDIGGTITIWTRPYGGLPAEMWEVPTNKPIWGPRYLAEQIKRKCFHRLVMNDHRQTGSDHTGTYVGGIVADTIKHRLNAQPAPKAQMSFNRKVSNF
jgi:hypothetical protein